jgi:16S rRNA pseudouridine516 synthase
MGKATRSESARLARQGKILVNGVPIKKSDVHVNPEKDEIVLCGAKIEYKKFTYIMLNKPEGYVSAVSDDLSPTVLELLSPELQKIGLFPCGRLDKNTLGLMILTNNGPLAHKLLSPRFHVDKKYRFEVKFPMSESDVNELEGGVDIGGYFTAPCKVELVGEREGYITLTEGKYHQIKRMIAAQGNRVSSLERVRFAEITLDTMLSRGEWRFLTDDEIKILLSHAK